MTQDKQSVNEHVVEHLDYYCGLPQVPKYAVLLKGKWGCGKTWFINWYREKAKEEQEQKFLYVSLNGITSFSEIEEAFLQEEIPFLGYKPVALGRSFATHFLKSALKYNVNDDFAVNSTLPGVKLIDFLVKLEQNILIFDDLERCQIELSEILGYINNFVEHKGIKVIIVADEEQLEKKYNNYKTIKEKVIGQTLDVFLDFDRALENFITKLANSDVRKFLAENIHLIENVYTKAEYKNLRTLNKAILDFERIFNSLPEKVIVKSDALQEILNILLALSIEIKSEELDPKDINRLKNVTKFNKECISTLSNQVSGYPPLKNLDTSSKEALESLHSILQKYTFINFYTAFPSLVWWQEFFDKGILDAQELDKSIKSSKYFEDETHSWIKLWHYYYLEDEEFEKLLSQVELEYANKNFDDPGVIKHITGMFLRYSEAGLLHKSKEEILDNSKRYIDWLKDRDSSKLALFSFSTGDIILGGYVGLSFQGANFKEFNEFCTYLEEVQKAAKNENLLNAGQEILAAMQSDVWKFQEMVCLYGTPYRITANQQYHKIPVLKQIKESDFVNKFLSLKFDDKETVCNSLIKRYEAVDYHKELIDELDWLKSVRDLVQEEIVRKQGKISGHILEVHVKPALKEAISKLEGKTN